MEYAQDIAPFVAYEEEIKALTKDIEYVTTAEIRGLDSKPDGYITDEEIEWYLSTFNLTV
jgi:hypothetical protein